ncbi:MAG: P-loop NTPase [Acidimicrobiia bacterium]|nr:P-loop NTPase [Acidimicrobiia bacterium]
MRDVVLASAETAFEDRIRSAFNGTLNGQLARISEPNVDRLIDQDPAIIALGPDLQVDEMLTVVEEIDRRRPEITVMMIVEPTASLWERALRAGARDLIDPETSDELLREAIERAMKRSTRQRQNVVARYEPPDAPPEVGHGRILVVASPKGGSGKTMLASNLAYGLARRHPSEVAVVDLDLQFGDIGTALRLSPEYSMAHALEFTDDPVQLKSFMTAHPAGFWALCAPDSPGVADELSAEAVQKVLATLSREFPFLVVDTGAGLDEHTLTALDMATDHVLVSTTDVTAIQSLRKVMVVLDQLDLEGATRHVVLNRANAKVGLTTEDIERTIGLPIETRIPSARIVPTAMNQGTPILEDNARSSVGRSIDGLIERLDPVHADGSRRSRRQRRKGAEQ